MAVARRFAAGGVFQAAPLARRWVAMEMRRVRAPGLQAPLAGVFSVGFTIFRCQFCGGRSTWRIDIAAALA
jgi:hypothetical protein